MFQDFHYNLKQKSTAVDMDLKALYYEGEDFIDFTYPDINNNLISLSDFKGELVYIDVWASWCGPCKMVAPVLEELAAELDGKLTIGKVDVDSNRDSAAKQNVMSIPTLILFKDGQPIDQRIGALTKNQLQEFINEHI